MSGFQRLDLGLIHVGPGGTGLQGHALEGTPQSLEPYSANAVDFDGSDYLTRGAGLTDAADSKLLTVSFWINKQGANGASEHIVHAAITGPTERNAIVKGGGDNIQVVCRNSAGSIILNVGTATDSFEVADGWRHYLASFDLTSTAKRHIYVNDVDGYDPTFPGTTYTNDTIDFTVNEWVIGNRPDLARDLDAYLADLWIAPGVYIDFTVEANRRKFIDASGKPVYLGSDGSGPIGTAPLIFLSGPTADWHTNKGTGGGFTENGALTDAASSPSD